jgi:hypothetical protein
MFIGLRRSTVHGTINHLLKQPLLWVIAAAFFCSCCTRTDSRKHIVSVTFDYDFTQNHPCSPTIVLECIAQFNVYDLGAGKPVKLFSIPAPIGAHTPVRDIIGRSQPLTIGTGKHVLAVSAQMSSGQESKMQECTAGTILP